MSPDGRSRLGLGAALALAASAQLAIVAGRRSLGLALYILAAAIFLVADRAAAAPPIRPPRAWFERLCLGVALVLAVAVRCWQLDESWTPDSLRPVFSGMYFDEASEALAARQILEDGSFRPVYYRTATAVSAGHAYWLAGWMAALGIDPLTLRLSSVASGVAGWIAGVALARLLFGAWTGIAAALLLACSFWPVHFSRLVWGPVHVPFLTCAFLYAIARGVGFRAGSSRVDASSSGWMAVAGLAGALGAYAYLGFLPALAIGAILWARVVVESERKRDHLRALLAGAATFAVVSLPHAAHFVGAPSELLARPSAVSIAGEVEAEGSLAPLGRSIVRTLLMFHAAPDARPRHGPPFAPIVDPASAVLLALGWLHAVRRARAPAMLLVAIWPFVVFPAAVLTGSGSNPHALRTVVNLPWASIVAAIAAVHLGTALLPRARAARAAAMLGAASLLLGLNLDLYFRRYAADRQVYFEFDPVPSSVSRLALGMRAGDTLALAPILWRAPQCRLFAPQGVDVEVFEPTDALPPRPPVGASAVIALQEDAEGMLPLLQAAVPQAEPFRLLSPWGDLLAVGIRASLEALAATRGARLRLLDATGREIAASRLAAWDLSRASAELPWARARAVEISGHVRVRSAERWEIDVATDVPATLDAGGRERGVGPSARLELSPPAGWQPFRWHLEPLRGRRPSFRASVVAGTGGRPADPDEASLAPHPPPSVGLRSTWRNGRAETGIDPSWRRIDPAVFFTWTSGTDRFGPLSWSDRPYPGPFELTFDGEILIPADIAVVSLEAPGETTLSIGGRDSLAAEGGRTLDRSALQPGWQTLSLRLQMPIGFRYAALTWRRAGGRPRIVPPDALRGPGTVGSPRL